MSHFYRIPFAQIGAANALAVSICGNPVFLGERSRGASRATSYAYAHGFIGTRAEDTAFAAQIAGLGGTAIFTEGNGSNPSEIMSAIGRARRPDLDGLTTPELVALALEAGITPTPQAREEIIEAFEAQANGEGVLI